MKKYLYSLAIAATVLGMSSCDSKQEEPHIQWYPVVTLEGEDTYYIEVGDNFILPGYSAINTITMQDATSAVVVEIYDVIADEVVDAISTDGPGMYNVYYYCPASEVPSYYVDDSGLAEVYKQRDIYVYDPTIETDISGYYNINMQESTYLGRITVDAAAGEYLVQPSFAEATAFYGNVDSCTIRISQLLPGFFYVSDLLGGWYEQIRGYGSSYAMTGYISLNSDDSITLLSSYVRGWGDGLDGMWDGEYDPETETISYETWYAGSVGFYIVMTNADAE